MRALVSLLLFVGGMSCAAAPSRPAPPGHPPLAWRLAESAAPGGRELVFERYDPTAEVKISIRFLRERASVGEEVEAEVRLPEATGLHRLEILPDRDGVTVLGPRELWVDGPAPAAVRFTSRTPGRGGITVVLKE
jgi:hypothetical protein